MNIENLIPHTMDEPPKIRGQKLVVCQILDMQPFYQVIHYPSCKWVDMEPFMVWWYDLPRVQE